MLTSLNASSTSQTVHLNAASGNVATLTVASLTSPPFSGVPANISAMDKTFQVEVDIDRDITLGWEKTKEVRKKKTLNIKCSKKKTTVVEEQLSTVLNNDLNPTTEDSRHLLRLLQQANEEMRFYKKLNISADTNVPISSLVVVKASMRLFLICNINILYCII
jgi:hypothetical protein